jgi:hypothetical protein
LARRTAAGVTATRIALAVVAGVVVASLSFWHYAAAPGSPAPHGDHEPWYGGQLGMVGDHHIELVRGERDTQVYVSDAWRRPVRPASASVVVDGGSPIDLHPEGDAVVADTPLKGGKATVTAVLSDGRRLVIGFTLEPD